MFGIPTFDLLTDRGKQEFIQYVINLMRNEIISFTSSYNQSASGLSQNLPDTLLVNAHMIGTNALRPNAGEVTPGTYYTSTDVSGGTTYRSDGIAWTQISGGVQGGTLGYYGSFVDTTTQSVATVNTATAITFNTTLEANGVSRGFRMYSLRNYDPNNTGTEVMPEIVNVNDWIWGLKPLRSGRN